MNRPTYDSTFYSTYADESMQSALEILSIVKDVVNPKSVVDVGCGVGTWLKVWQDIGLEDILGIDGEYVRPDDLLIPLNRFKAMDLSAPTRMTNQFDLVQSLEVAEHLPERVADAFVSFLCSLGPIVLFGAAIPYQGGTRHINEQWPEYWAELFRCKGYVPVDAIRDRVWDNPKVAYYYAQNTLFFVQTGRVDILERIGRLPVVPVQRSLSRVHPRKWHEKNERPLPLEVLVRMLPRSSLDLSLRLFRKIREVLARD
jgi:SAM-dependent methyltransferase